MSEADADWHRQGPERLYVITGGRNGQTGKARLDLVTLVVARAEAGRGMPPEHAAILRLCTSPLSVAELAAYLRLPFSVVTVLLGDLLAEDLVATRLSTPPAVDRPLIEEIIHGLEQL